ncbi:OmpH family outer membrane protein [Fluviicola sp. SGL-29]|nr:OmpH family outer membrane protein [Fluviicola sp. SGL-29]
MKKLLFVGAVAASLVACKSGKKEDKAEQADIKTEAANIEGGVKIAYYILDSVAENFDVYKTELEVFEKEGAKLQAQLEGMQAEYQSVYVSYEDGARKQILTPNQMASYEQKLGALQQKMGDFQNTKMVAFQQKQMDATTAIQNKITKYSEEFSKQNGIDLFFVSGTGTQIAYANSGMDLTVKFVAYMNEQEKTVGK